MVGATMVVATVPVSDLVRAKAFYAETLGLTVLWENPASVRLRCGESSELSIFKRPSTVTEHTVAHVAKGVKFLDYAEGPLRTTGHIAQIGSARAAWFRDPDGNTLVLRQG